MISVFRLFCCSNSWEAGDTVVMNVYADLPKVFERFPDEPLILVLAAHYGRSGKNLHLDASKNLAKRSSF
jgi:hypothetical protein